MGEPHIDLLAYFVTFRCYGTWLHGDERGSVDRAHNVPGEPLLEPDARREAREQELLKYPPQRLNAERRSATEAALLEACGYRGWAVSAINVRTNHVHVVLTADGVAPEEVMRVLKARATRHLRELGLLERHERLWSEHGSTIYLWTQDQVGSAIWYVREGQDHQDK